MEIVEKAKYAPTVVAVVCNEFQKRKYCSCNIVNSRILKSVLTELVKVAC